MNAKQLAEMMGQKESEVIAFVECLRVWINKGCTIEQAIERHMEQMTRMVNHADKLPKSIAVDAFYA